MADMATDTATTTLPAHAQSYGAGLVSVVYVKRTDAKRAKSALEDAHLLNKNFRMAPAAMMIAQDGATKFPAASPLEMIALPVVDDDDAIYELELSLCSSSQNDKNSSQSWRILGRGKQICPFSTKVMGGRTISHIQPRKGGSTTDENHHHRADSFSLTPSDAFLTPLQRAILGTLRHHISSSRGTKNWDDDANNAWKLTVLEDFQRLGRKVCPQKLEVLGDDRTLVLPPGAFEGTEFWTLLVESSPSLLSSSLSSPVPAVCTNASSRRNTDQEETEMDKRESNNIEEVFWRHLMAVHGSQRIVRRGTIDPESGIRQSGHRLLFPFHGVPKMNGPGSPGWIRVTEQGIHQSFDLTRVMFSRGNISEKIRFGKRLVREGETILDMYAGIGYYTLPALIHGKARHVVACEWNEHAIRALRYNIKDN